MDGSRIKAALASVRQAINDVKVTEQKLLADPKADIAVVDAASTSLRTLGSINKTFTKAEARITKRLEPAVKKERKKKAPAAGK